MTVCAPMQGTDSSLFARGEDKEEPLRGKAPAFFGRTGACAQHDFLHARLPADSSCAGGYAIRQICQEALPDGAQRGANLAMLVEKAMDYEKDQLPGAV